MVITNSLISLPYCFISLFIILPAKFLNFQTNRLFYHIKSNLSMISRLRETIDIYALYKSLNGYNFRENRHKYSRQCLA
jgi:hypothetical protein